MHKSMADLSELLLGVDAERVSEVRRRVLDSSDREFNELLELAHLNHVVVRALSLLLHCSNQESNNPARVVAVQSALTAELSRIQTATFVLHEVCRTLEKHGHRVLVIKSLDHWPDLGSDLDLFTDSTPTDICKFMMSHFKAAIAARSWGDRLACKWNFMIPSLPEPIEIHIGRLGQTGEQAVIASSLIQRSRLVQIHSQSFRVASIPDRIMISVLQRMYRHFFFRLCDIVDSAEVIEAGLVDYAVLRSRSTEAGIWEGVATYLRIVSDYVGSYRGTGLALPRYVIQSARFGGEKVYYGNSFLRVPIMPQSVGLYGTQLAGLFKKGELQNGARLSLLPWLASAALLGQKITGSDKGIW